MIKTRHHGEIEHFDVGFAGTQTTGHKQTILIPFACQLKALYAVLGTAGTTGTQTVDILKNGTSIFSGATLINFATTATTATYGPLTTNPTTLAKGDLLVVNIAAVHTTPGVDLGLCVVLQRLRGAGQVAQMVTGGVGVENE